MSATDTDAISLARLSLHDPNNVDIQHSQTRHRLELLRHFNIAAGSNVLELGCGQGDCTVVIADAVGDEGMVVGVDPADLEYGKTCLVKSGPNSLIKQHHDRTYLSSQPDPFPGTPFTLGQAQNHISLGPLGHRITWIQQDPLSYLSFLSSPASGTSTFHATVLAHSLWYFSSPSLILATFHALKQHSRRLYLAEWSLMATNPAAHPHVLAVLAQAALECRKPTSVSNVRTVVSPKRLKELAQEAGWQLESEGRVHPNEGVLDGQWEVAACLSETFEKEVEECVADERERGVVRALGDACEASLVGIEGGQKGVRSMDVWVGSFVQV